ncbi:unnamed protein product [Arctogadus glacialis]
MLTADNHGKPKGVITCRHLSKYALIFLLLTLSGLIFLLIYMLNLEDTGATHCLSRDSLHPSQNLSCHTASMLFQPQSSSHTAFAQKAPLPPYYNYTFCSHLEPTPEEALEDRYLLNSIAWPKSPTGPAPAPLIQSSDPVHSLFNLLPLKIQREWRVGDQLEALVQMHDFQGRPKRYGGDFLVARLHSPELGAGVAGRVVDHLNGSYLALFPLLWQGTVEVVITMVHSSEGVAVLQRLQEQRSDRVFFKSLFRSGKRSETTICNKKNLITNKEALLLQSGVNIKVVIHASGPDRINVLPGKKDEIKKQQHHTRASQIHPFWCLTGKVIHMYGDSTVRQWFEYLNALVPEIKELNLHSPQRSGPSWRWSGLPGGADTVVAISIWSHFSTFPVEVYITPHAAHPTGTGTAPGPEPRHACGDPLGPNLQVQNQQKR